MAGAHEHDVTATDDDALGLLTSGQLGSTDRLAWLEPLAALGAGQIEQDAAADHRAARATDVVASRSLAGHVGRWKAVVHPALEKNMCEGVPLRTGLQRHDDQVVGGAQVPVAPVLRHPIVAEIRVVVVDVAAVADHQVDGIKTSPVAATDLRAARVVRDRERVDLALDRQCAGAGDVRRRQVVEGAELVVRAPAAPVGVLRGERPHGFDVLHAVSSLCHIPS